MTTLPRPSAEPKAPSSTPPNASSTRGEQLAFYFFMGTIGAGVLLMVYLLITI